MTFARNFRMEDFSSETDLFDFICPGNSPVTLIEDLDIPLFNPENSSTSHHKFTLPETASVTPSPDQGFASASSVESSTNSNTTDDPNPQWSSCSYIYGGVPESMGRSSPVHQLDLLTPWMNPISASSNLSKNSSSELLNFDSFLGLVTLPPVPPTDDANRQGTETVEHTVNYIQTNSLSGSIFSVTESAKATINIDLSAVYSSPPEESNPQIQKSDYLIQKCGSEQTIPLNEPSPFLSSFGSCSSTSLPTPKPLLDDYLLRNALEGKHSSILRPPPPPYPRNKSPTNSELLKALTAPAPNSGSPRTVSKLTDPDDQFINEFLFGYSYPEPRVATSPRTPLVRTLPSLHLHTSPITPLVKIFSSASLHASVEENNNNIQKAENSITTAFKSDQDRLPLQSDQTTTFLTNISGKNFINNLKNLEGTEFSTIGDLVPTISDRPAPILRICGPKNVSSAQGPRGRTDTPTSVDKEPYHLEKRTFKKKQKVDDSPQSEDSIASVDNEPVQTGHKPKKKRLLHNCNICSKGFKDKYSVKVHVRTHTGEKLFSCPVCGKSFRQRAHLAKHNQTHVENPNRIRSRSKRLINM